MNKKLIRRIVAAAMACAAISAFAIVGCTKPDPEPNVQEYTVSYNANGHGTAHAAAKTVDGKVVKPLDLSLEGYTFEGWYTDAACKTEFDFNTVLEEDITLYANWTVISYTITYEGVEGVTANANPTSYTIEDSVILVDVAKDGYKFDGWYEGEIKVIEITNSTGNKKLTAKWTKEAEPEHTHTEVEDPAVEPTCTEAGKTEGKHCSVCGTVIVAQEVVPVIGHTEVVDPAVEPTCTEAGKTAGKHCSVCNTVTVAQEVVPAKGHTEVEDPAVAATCTEAGKTEGKHCSVCNTVTVAQEEVAATGHVDANNDGKCDKCEYQMSTPVEPHTHTAGTTWECDATNHWNLCTGNDGYKMNVAAHADTNKDGKCEVCTYEMGIPVEPHTHTEVVDPAVEPTCTETGKTAGKHCSVCNAVIVAQEVVPAKGHTEVEDPAVAATCTEAGKTAGKHCSVCNAVIVAQGVVPVIAHVDTNNDGKCDTCGYQMSTPVEPHTHTEVEDPAVAPTCTEAGKTEGKHCSVCGTVIVAQVVVPAKGHTEVVDAAVAPTCTVAGKTEGKHCSVCGTVIVAQGVVPVIAHVDTNNDGKCDTCGYQMSTPVEPHTHTEVEDPAVEPTCTEAGKTEGKHCSVCGTVTVAQVVVPAKGHTEVEDPAVAATCTEAGKTEGKHCSVCGTVTVAQVVVPAKGHTEVVDAAVAPTCTEAGKTAGKHCSVCNTVTKAQEVVPVIPHTDTNNDGKCDKCGYQMSTPEPTPDGYTANGTYTLDIAGGKDSGLFTSVKASATSDSGYQGGKYFKVATGDYLYINMKLQKNKVITLSGKAITSNKADSSKSTTLGISLKADSTATVSGIPSEKKINQADGEQAFNFEYTVSAEGTVVIQLTRKTGNTGCEINELSVTIADMGPVAVKGISISKTTSAVKVGATETLSATVTPANADNTNVTWSSSNESVATVDQNGVVKALKAGTAVITATAAGDTTKTATCTYTVTNVAPTGISLGRAEATIEIGGYITLTPTISPDNATVKTVTWSSSAPSIAKVDANGKVTGVTAGEATITATSTENANVKTTIKIKVLTEIVNVTGVKLDQTTATITMEESVNLQLTATVTPANATNKYVTWTSSDETIAIVDESGKVTARKGGNIVITVTTDEGAFEATCAIEVIAPPRLAGTPEITKSSVNEMETAYVEWILPDGQADWFNVYYKEEAGSAWTKLDAPLVRQYANYYRADMVGLKAGTYAMKVVPVRGSAEVPETAAISNGITVKAHDRAGYAFVNGTSSGAYNDDGTLKTDASVVYITETTKDSVSLDVTGATTNPCVGLQNILNGYKKGKESKPLCVRLIGNITDFATMLDGDIVIENKNNAAGGGITIEGIGNDATANGWGIRVKNASNVEIRNIGLMNCNSGEGDNIGLQQGNDHVWVHNCDFFYGDAGSDADQAKGDGALDTKTSTYVTHSYNRFFDSGKSNLQGMKSESTSNYITYHHNWYDHSDSRHPRIRTCTVHIYNNYFDGNAKYGVGVTMGASAFVEANYFRSTSVIRPMMSSGQGTDAQGDGTFSGENGGIIKAFANVYDTAGGGTLNLRTYQEFGQESDCYEVTSREQTVPSSYTTVKGGTTYNNFDTASDFYKYNVESAEQAKATVMEYAGRLEGGDFKWTFDNKVDDPNYAVDTKLKAAIVAYKGSVVKIGG